MSYTIPNFDANSETFTMIPEVTIIPNYSGDWKVSGHKLYQVRIQGHEILPEILVGFHDIFDENLVGSWNNSDRKEIQEPYFNEED